MASERQKERITRGGRGPGEPEQARKSQPGSYRRHWEGMSAAEVPDWVPSPHYASMVEAPGDLVQRAVREKLPWIERFVDEGCPHARLLPYARAYAKSKGIPESEIPPYSTLNQWVHQYSAWGVLGLVDKARKDAGTSRTVVGQAAEALYLAVFGGKKNPTGAARFATDHLPLDEEPPNIHAYRRAVHRLLKKHHHLAAVAREGIGRFEDGLRLAMKHLLLPGGHELAIDSTVADIWIKVMDAAAKGGFRAVRPVLTLVQDVGTRMVVTFNYSIYRIDSGIIKGTFLRAVDASANYPGLISTGIPERVVSDRGGEHRGAFDDLLAALGIKHRTSSQPEGRARIERMIGTTGTMLFGTLPGYSPLEKIIDPYAPPEHDTRRDLRHLQYDPYRLERHKGSLLDLHELEAQTLAFFQVHNEKPHSSLPVNSPEVQKLVEDAMTVMRPEYQIEEEAA